MKLELHPKQTKAFKSTATELLYGGAAGGGKSHLMRIASIVWCAEIPGLQVYLFRRQHGDLQKNHMEGPSSYHALLEEWILKKLVKITGDSMVTFWNGSKIFLGHCQHEQDRFNHLGSEMHVLMMDELTTFTEVIYRFFRSRCRMALQSADNPAGIALPEKYKGQFPKIICSSNPGNVGHNWVKQFFVDNAPEGEIVQMSKDEGGRRRQYINAKLDDNPSLDKETYEGDLMGLGDPAMVKAMLDGDWDIVSGGMMDDVWDRNIHVLEPFKIPSSWTIDRSFDWGSSKPFSVGWWAESDGTAATMADGTKIHFPAKTLIRIGEWYGWNGKADTGIKTTAKVIAEGIKSIEAEMGIAGRVKPGPADASIYDTQNGNCIATDMQRAGVKWVKANKAPGTRVSGCQLVRERLAAAKQFPMEDPAMFVFNSCTDGFIRTIPVLPRDSRKPEDVDTSAEDHTYDEVRYRCLHTVPTVRLGRMVA